MRKHGHPGKGEGTVSLTYQNYDVAGHYDARGRKNNNGGTQSHAAITEVISASRTGSASRCACPSLWSKYTGPDVYFVGGVETHPGPLDDRTYHGAFQDLQLEVRRLLWAGPIPVAPSSPRRSRLTITRQSEKVPGRGRRDLQLGASIGVNFDRLLGGAYAHGRYGCMTAQRIQGFAFTRSNVDVEVGAPVGSRVVVRGLAAGRSVIRVRP